MRDSGGGLRTGRGVDVILLDPASTAEAIPGQSFDAEDSELATHGNNLARVFGVMRGHHHGSGQNFAWNTRRLSMKIDALATEVVGDGFRDDACVVAKDQRPMNHDADPTAPVSMGQSRPCAIVGKYVSRSHVHPT